MQFGDYLENLIRERNISINALSAECNINRGNLYNVFKRQRKLKGDQLFTLISKLALTQSEEKELKELYFKDFYGNISYEKIQFLLEQVQNCILQEDELNNADFNNKAVSAISRLVQNNDRIITNFPFDFIDADKLFYSAVKSGQLKELKHIFAFDKKDNFKHNYSTVFKAIKYMILGQLPFYYYTKISPPELSAIMPYFAIGEKTALLFCKDDALEIKDAKQIKLLTDKAQAMLASCTRLGTATDDAIQVKNVCQDGVEKGDVSYVLADYPCLAQYVDYDTMKSAVRPELPDKDALVQIAYAHYKNFYSCIKQIGFATEYGVTRFAKTGNFCEISSRFINCVSEEHRIKLLNRLRRAIEEDEFYILDKNKFNMPKGLVIEKYANKVLLFHNDTDKENFSSYDSFYAEIKDYSFVNDMKLTVEYLIESRKVCPKEYSLDFIDTLLATLGAEM